MAAPYLEHFLDTLEPLPAELQRNFTLMKDLDSRTCELVQKINQNATDYVETAGQMPPPDKSSQLKRIHEMFDKAKEYSDDKVQLAMQTYEMVDKHIRRLDTELAKFEAELKDKQINAKGTSSANGSVKAEETSGPGKAGKKNGRGRAGKKKTFSPKNVVKEVGKGSRKKQQEPPAPAPAPIPVMPIGIGSGVPGMSSEVLVDMPVDPNEPTYCLCHQVSYGEMIGCDNAECPIEWFHFPCVQLTSKPKGKWYCPNCRQKKN